MKEGWEYKKLGEVCSIVGRIGFRGYTKADLVKSSEDGAITLSPSNIVNGELDFSKCTYINWGKYFESPEIMLENGDIVLVKTASIGKCAVVKDLPHESTLNPQFVVLKQINGVSDFFCYYLKSPKAQNLIKIMAGGVAIPTLSQKKLGMMPIPVPSLSEQQRIVDYLDSAFAKIYAMKANAEKSLNEATALFQTSLKEMLEPKEGWEEKKLMDLGQTQTGTTPSKSDKANYGDYMEFIRPSEIDYDGNGGIDYNSEMKLSEQGVSKGKIFPSNSIFMVCIGATIGKVGFSTKKVSCNQQINVFTPKEKINYKFAYYAMRSPLFQHRVLKEGTSSQATLPIINKGKWENLSIRFPEINEQKIIASHLDNLSSKIAELKANFEKISQECDALKQAILRQVFE